MTQYTDEQISKAQKEIEEQLRWQKASLDRRVGQFGLMDARPHIDMKDVSKFLKKYNLGFITEERIIGFKKRGGSLFEGFKAEYDLLTDHELFYTVGSDLKCIEVKSDMGLLSYAVAEKSDLFVSYGGSAPIKFQTRNIGPANNYVNLLEILRDYNEILGYKECFEKKEYTKIPRKYFGCYYDGDLPMF